MRLVLFLLALLSFPTVGLAQHNHARGHNDYLGWSSQKTSNCCNNDDCGEVHEHDVRATPAGYEVAIENQWCPVLREHWITKGKSPNFTSYHACVQKKTEYNKTTPPCERLLCFAGKGGM